MKINMLNPTIRILYDGSVDILIIRFAEPRRFAEGHGEPALLFYEEETNEALGFEILCFKKRISEAKRNSLDANKLFRKREKFVPLPKLEGEWELAPIGYDEKEDALHFGDNKNTEPGIGIDMGKGIIFRVDEKKKKLLGMSIFNITKLLQTPPP